MIRGEFASALRQLPAHRRFDLALLDPPYEEADVEGALCAAAARMAPGASLVLEHAARRQVPGRVEAWALVRQVTAGDSTLAFFREAAAPAADVTEGS
jgi:16S rRNA G966 N2-methylase RsmD